jgi:hypothetical protein
MFYPQNIPPLRHCGREPKCRHSLARRDLEEGMFDGCEIRFVNDVAEVRSNDA